MISYLIMILSCIFIASIVQKRLAGFDTIRQGKHYDLVSAFLILVIIAWMISFAGLRTGYNDTYTYKETYKYSVELGPIILSNYSLFGYGGFELFQSILKNYICENSQCLIFTSSLIIVPLFVNFIIKHTEYFAGSIALFFFGLYNFSMGGIKQAFSIAIFFWAIDAYSENKKIKAILLGLLAFSFHPYVICMFAFVFLRDRCWSIKSISICVAVLLAMSNLQIILSFAAAIGKEYSIESFTDSTINPIRVFVELVPVAISFVHRNEINESGDDILILGTNMNIIGFVFIFLGLFYDPMFMGRIATYFTALSMISIPKMLEVSYGRSGNSIFKSGYYMFVMLYFLSDTTKLGQYSIFMDPFDHITFARYLEILLNK